MLGLQVGWAVETCGNVRDYYYQDDGCHCREAPWVGRRNAHDWAEVGGNERPGRLRSNTQKPLRFRKPPEEEREENQCDES